jgi:hypothetical protein
MKINKLLIIISLVVTAFIVSCEDYEDKVVPSPTVSEDSPAVRFAADNITEYELEPSITDIKVTVIRNGSESAIEVPIIVIENTKNSFDVPATLSFPAGQDTVILSLPINSDNAPLGEEIILGVKFGEEYSNPYLSQYNSFYGKITILNWQLYATGTYTSAIYGNATWEQELYKAQGTEKYRFFDLYAEGYNFNFSWDGGEAITPEGELDADGYYIFMPGISHPTYGEMTVHVDSDPAYTFYDEEGAYFQIEGKWTVAAGSLGWKDDYFEITTLH